MFFNMRYKCLMNRVLCATSPSGLPTFSRPKFQVILTFQKFPECANATDKS